MSTSIFKGAKVFSFRTEQEGVGFVWAENTFDERDGHETARWDVTAIGSRERIVERIFKVAANVPGGSTSVRYKSVQRFISAMLDLLSAPPRLDDTHIYLTNARDEDDHDACVRTSNRSLVVELLNRHGLTDAAVAMRGPRSVGGMSVQLDLATHFPLVEDLVSQDLVLGGEVRKNAGIQPWRLMPNLPMGYSRGPTPPQASAKRHKAPGVQMLKASIPGDGYGADGLFACLVDSEFFDFDQPWAIERSLICRAGDAETQSPGYYSSLLKAYEAARGCPEPLPGGTLLQFDARGAEDYYRVPLHALSAKVFGAASDQFEMTIDDFGRAYGDLGESSDESLSIMYKLRRTLSHAQFVRFVLPERATENQTQGSMTFERQRG